MEQQQQNDTNAARAVTAVSSAEGAHAAAAAGSNPAAAPLASNPATPRASELSVVATEASSEATASSYGVTTPSSASPGSNLTATQSNPAATQSNPVATLDEFILVPSLFNDIRRTFRLFWPILLGQLASTAMSVVDTVMAGAAGTIDLSGVAIGASFYWPAVLFVMGMTLAIQPNVAQLRGAGRSHEIAHKMHTSTIICLITSVIVGIGMCFLPLFYQFVPDINQDMVRVGQGYVFAVATGMPAIALFNVLRGYWEGLGITIPTSIFGFIALFLNIPLNWIFIFGKFGAPQLGGIGCGVATSITLYITIIFMFIYVKKSKTFAPYRIFERWYSISKEEVKQFLHFSIPLALSTTIEVTCFSIVALLLSPFGPTTVASHTIAMNVSGVIFMIPMAIASASTIRIGEAMGSGHWLCAKRIVQGAFTLGLFFYVIYFIAILLGNGFIINLYSDDVEVAALASLLLIYCATFLLPDGMQVIGIGILRGFKDSRTIFIVTVVSYWIIGMPIGYSLTYGLFTGERMGAPGFWIGFICSLGCACVLYLFRLVYLFKSRKLPKTFAIIESFD